MKYIDPSYMVRAVAANAADNLCCTLLAHSAIDGAMAGYTGFVPGLINGNYGYIPVVEVAEARNSVDTSGLGSGSGPSRTSPTSSRGHKCPCV